MDFRRGEASGGGGAVIYRVGQTTIVQMSGGETSQRLIDRLIRFREFVLGAILSFCVADFRRNKGKREKEVKWQRKQEAHVLTGIFTSL